MQYLSVDVLINTETENSCLICEQNIMALTYIKQRCQLCEMIKYISFSVLLNIHPLQNIKSIKLRKISM
jgi:hypothetical protein